MRIVVVGAGALGGLVGAHLTESGEESLLLEINRARARLLNENGLFIAEADKGERCVRVRVIGDLDSVGQADLVFVAVKSYETENAVRGAMPVIGPSTRVLSMQNGIGNTDLMARLLGPERVLCGITYHSIQHTGPNRLRYRPGIKPIQIAPYDGKITPEIREIGEVFRRSGLHTDVVENIDHTVWRKLLHNAVVNPVSALTGLTCRELLDDADLQMFMRDLCMEIIAVMRARGVPIEDEEDPYRPVLGSQRALGKNRPSMWQDLTRGQRTEIDAINGAIADEAARLGLPAPLNWGLVRFIHSRERQRVLSRQPGGAPPLPLGSGTTTAAASASAARPAIQHPLRPTDFAPQGGMPAGRVPLRAASKLKELLKTYYMDLSEAAADPRRRVAWTTAMGPAEIVRALGFTPYFPENHAALIGASRQTVKYIPRALAEGFSQFASSAMTSDIGASLAGDSPLVTVYGIPGPPKPDAIVYNTNNGQSLAQWFAYYGQQFNIPILGLHPPVWPDSDSHIELDGAVQQTLRLVTNLEAIAGEKLDMDRLAQVVEYSARAADLWMQILGLARTVPSPFTFFDVLIHVAPMILLRGTPEAVAYYTVLKEELEERVANHEAAVPGERFRFYWEGPPIWCSLRALARLFLEHRVAIVASTYARIFALEGLDPANPIESLTRAYTSIFTNCSEEHKAAFLLSQMRDYAVDGAVYHDGRTAPEHSNVRYGLAVRLQRATGIPSLVLEADTHDLRLFSLDQITRQLEEFMELKGFALPGVHP